MGGDIADAAAIERVEYPIVDAPSRSRVVGVEDSDTHTMTLRSNKGSNRSESAGIVMHDIPFSGMGIEETVKGEEISPKAGATLRKAEKAGSGRYDFIVEALGIFGKNQKVNLKFLAVKMSENVHHKRLSAIAGQMARNHKYTLHGTKIALGREICKSFINFAVK